MTKPPLRVAPLSAVVATSASGRPSTGRVVVVMSPLRGGNTATAAPPVTRPVTTSPQISPAPAPRAISILPAASFLDGRRGTNSFAPQPPRQPSARRIMRSIADGSSGLGGASGSGGAGASQSATNSASFLNSSMRLLSDGNLHAAVRQNRALRRLMRRWRVVVHGLRFVHRCASLKGCQLTTRETRVAHHLYNTHLTEFGVIETFAKLRQLVFACGQLITDEELMTMTRATGFRPGTHFSEQQFMHLLRNQKRAFMKMARASDTEAVFYSLLEERDSDISIQRLLQICAEFKLSSDVGELIASTDVDGSGRIDLDEFEELLGSNDGGSGAGAGSGLADSAEVAAGEVSSGSFTAVPTVMSAVGSSYTISGGDNGGGVASVLSGILLAAGGTTVVGDDDVEFLHAISAVTSNLTLHGGGIGSGLGSSFKGGDPEDVIYDFQLVQDRLREKEATRVRLCKPLRPASCKAAGSSARAFHSSSRRQIAPGEPVLAPLPAPTRMVPPVNVLASIARHQQYRAAAQVSARHPRVPSLAETLRGGGTPVSQVGGMGEVSATPARRPTTAKAWELFNPFLGLPPASVRVGSAASTLWETTSPRPRDPTGSPSDPTFLEGGARSSPERLPALPASLIAFAKKTGNLEYLPFIQEAFAQRHRQLRQQGDMQLAARRRKSLMQLIAQEDEEGAVVAAV